MEETDPSPSEESPITQRVVPTVETAATEELSSCAPIAQLGLFST